MRNKKIVIAAVIGMVIVIGVSALLNHWGNSSNEKRARCIGHTGNWYGIIDCYGVISIRSEGGNEYRVTNNTTVSSPLAMFDNVVDYFAEGTDLYVIDKFLYESECDQKEIPHKYCPYFKVDGVDTQFFYNNINDSPRYLIFDIQTGNQRFYTRLNEIPSHSRAIFEKMISKEGHPILSSLLWLIRN